MFGGMLKGGGAGKAKIITSSGSVTLGTDAGLNLLSTDTNNIALGTRALDAGSAAACTDNIAIGTDALGVNISGDSNVAIGTNAGAANSAKNNNVYIGKDAGKLSSGVYQTTIIGSRAGEALTSSSMVGNTIIGYLSCSGADGSAYFLKNTIIGASSATNAEFYGYQTTVIGYAAASGCTDTAIGTVAIGHESLSSATEGRGVSIGYGLNSWSAGNYPGQTQIGYNFGAIERIGHEITLSDAYTNADTDNRAAAGPLAAIPAYSFISRVIVRVDTLSQGTAKFNISLGTAVEGTGDAVAGRVEILGASGGTGVVTRSQGALTSATDIDASSGATDEMMWIANLNPETNNSVGWTAATNYLYVCHAGTGNATSDPGTDAKLKIVVEYYSLVG